MLRRFLQTLFSSWLTNPLGVVAAQLLGLTRQPSVLMYVLAAGACAPFQLLLNESLAAGRVRHTFTVTRVQFVSILLAQGAACAATLTLLRDREFSVGSIWLLTALLCMNSAVSYRCAVRYYALVIANRVTGWQACWIGATPGLVSLLIFTGLGLVTRLFTTLPPNMVFAVALLPSVAQLFYLRLLSANAQLAASVNSASPSGHALAIAVATMAAFTCAATTLRDEIAGHKTAYAALIVLVLNSTMTITNTVARASFLSRTGSSVERASWFGAVICAVVGAAVWHALPTVAPAVLLAGAQFCIVAAIEQARYLRASADTPRTHEAKAAIHRNS